jgi:thioredoxin
MSEKLQVTDATFGAEVEQAKGVVVVDFWATWCGPCLAVAPVIEKLAEDYAGKVKVLKLDTDANQATAMRLNIRSIPTILLFKDGKVVDGVIGADPRLRRILDEKIAKLAA